MIAMGVIPSDLISIQATGHILKNGCRAPSTTYPPPLTSHQWLETYDIKTKMLVCTTLIQTSIFYPSLSPHLRDFTDLLAGRIPSRARYLKSEEFLCSFLVWSLPWRITDPRGYSWQAPRRRRTFQPLASMPRATQSSRSH